MDQPKRMAAAPTCPHCEKPLELLRHVPSAGPMYFCLRHGRFWIDSDGRMREERRTIPRGGRTAC